MGIGSQQLSWQPTQREITMKIQDKIAAFVLILVVISGPKGMIIILKTFRKINYFLVVEFTAWSINKRQRISR